MLNQKSAFLSLLIVIALLSSYGYGESYNPCGPGQFLDPSTRNCSNCTLGCWQCASKQSCILCKLGFYQALPANPSQNPLPPQNCTACPDKNCLTCNVSVSSINPPCIVNGCAPGFFFNGTICTACIADCQACRNDTGCDVCKKGFLYTPASGNVAATCTAFPTQCAKAFSAQSCFKCNDGYYADSQNVCQKCMANCGQCSAVNNCNRCVDKYFFSISSGICTACNSNCQSCGLQGCDNCTLGYYKAGANVCTKCMSNCEHCQNGTSCEFCSQNYFFNQNQCQSCGSNCSFCDYQFGCMYCNTGFFINQTTHICQACSANCDNCNDTTTCNWCSNGYFFSQFNNSCVSTQNCSDVNYTDKGAVGCKSCMNGFFVHQDNGLCQPCMSNCLSCQSLQFCSNCAPNFYFVNSTQQCTQCDSHCQTCESTGCALCQKGFYQTQQGAACSNQCLANCAVCSSGTTCQTCLPNFFLDTTGSQSACTACSTGCKNCTSSTNCVECLNTFRLTSANTCAACPSNCDSCNANACLQCSLGYTNITDTVANPNTISCQKCTDFCNRCPQDNANWCDNCIDNFQFDTSQQNKQLCTPQQGYYVNGTSWHPCNEYISKCRDCTFTSSNCQGSAANHWCLTCNICEKTFYLKSSDGSCDQCENALTGCVDCANSTSCIYCKEGFFLKADATCAECSTVLPQCRSCHFDSASNKAVCDNCYNQNMFPNPTTGQCQNCSELFANCQSCGKGYNYTTNQQQLQCFQCVSSSSNMNDYYLNDTTNVCKKCNDSIPNCLSCGLDYSNNNGSSSNPGVLKCWQCLGQDQGLNLYYNKKCMNCSDVIPGCTNCGLQYPQSLPDGTQPDPVLTCSSCGNSGQKVFVNNTCMSCSQVVPNCTSCGIQQFSDPNDWTKQITQFQCYQCSNNGLLVYSSTQNKCVSCSATIPNCAYCYLDSSNYYLPPQIKCSSCIGNGNYYFDPKTQTCQLCNSTIPGCSNCYSLQYPYYSSSSGNGSSYYDQPSLICYQCQCGSNGITFFFNNQTQKCQSCNIPNCLQCQVITSQQFKSIPFNTSLVTCEQCAAGTYYDYLRHQCVSCASQLSNCLECEMETNFTALAYFEAGNKTMYSLPIVNVTVCKQCSAGFTFNYVTMQCESGTCPENCGLCLKVKRQSTPACFRCNDGFVLNYNDNQCVLNTVCPIGQVFNGTQCVACSTFDKNCFACSIGMQMNKVDILNLTSLEDVRNDIDCWWCQTGYVRQNGQCVPFQGANNCPDGCSSCTLNVGNVQCSACYNQNDWWLYNGICYSTKGGYYNYNYNYNSRNWSNIDYENNNNGGGGCKGSECGNGSSWYNPNCPEGCLDCYQDMNGNSTCILCQLGYKRTDDSKGKCQLIPKCAKGFVYHSFYNNCTACPDFCEACWLDVVFDKNTSSLVLDLALCSMCQPGFKFGPLGKCVPAASSNEPQQGGNFISPPWCDLLNWNTQMEDLECHRCSSGYHVEFQLMNISGVMFDQPSCEANCPNFCGNCSVAEGREPICYECIDRERFRVNGEGRCIFVSDPSCGTLTPPGIFNPTNSSCMSCPDNCKFCLWDNDVRYARCTGCKAGFRLTPEMLCKPKLAPTDPDCPANYVFFNATLGQCQLCPDNCRRCRFLPELKRVQCFQCQHGFQMDQGTDRCLMKHDKNNMLCLYNYYFSDKGINDMSKQNFTNNDTKTVVQYLLKSFAQFCLPCPIGCRSCEWSAVDAAPFCHECLNENGFFMQRHLPGLCLPRFCPVGQILNPVLGCQACPNFCKECQRNELGAVLCKLCIPGFKVNATATSPDEQCYFDKASCPAGTAADTSFCRPCPDLCSTCTLSVDSASGISSLVCTACLNPSLYTPVEGQCQKKCLDLQYFGPGGILGALDCYPCPLGCTACKFSQTTKNVICTACNKTLSFDLDTASSQCKLNLTSASTSNVTLCPATQIVVTGQDGSASCQDCPLGCAKCGWDSSAFTFLCFNCSSDKFVLDTTLQKCVPNITQFTTCNDGQRIDFTTGQCIACPAGCSKCFSVANSQFGYKCTACVSSSTSGSASYFFQDDMCNLKCGDGQMAIINPVDGSQTCKACTSPCSNCKMNYQSSPPGEMCFDCQTGFYISNGQCQAMPKCATSGFPALQILGFANYKAICVDCPFGCTQCQPLDITKPYDSVICTACNSQSYLNTATNLCRPNYENSKPQCSSTQYLKLDTATSQFTCVDCTAGCSGCDLMSTGFVTCYDCLPGYYFKHFSTYKTCVANPTCTSTQYVVFDSTSSIDSNIPVCKDCPSTCQSCKLKSLKDPNSLVCGSCASGFSLNAKNLCEKTATAETVVDATSCPSNTRQYPGVYNGFIKCATCPDACTKCGFSDPKTPSHETFSCTECSAGYVLVDSKKCQPKCRKGQYFDATTSSCLGCTAPCTICSSALMCQLCQDGYTIQKASTIDNGGKCMEIVVKQDKDCGQSAVYIKSKDECKCMDQSQIFDPSTLKCFSLTDWIAQSNCGSGQYRSVSLSTCLPCRSNDASSLCTACGGGQPADCVSCPSGYFLNKDKFACEACPSGCEQCSNANSCNLCAAGTFTFVTNDQTTTNGAVTTCLSSCSLGTLPYVGSMYFMNKNVFSDDQIKAKFDIANKPTDTTTRTDDAIAVGVFMEPVFDTVPWQLNSNGQPIYNSMLIRLSCMPCKVNCNSCYGKMLYAADLKQCFNQICPKDYVLKQVNNVDGTVKSECQKKQLGEFAIQRIITKTIAPDSKVQLISKKFYAEVVTTLDQTTPPTTITYAWSVLELKKDNVGLQKEGAVVTDMNDDYDSGVKQNYMFQLMDGVTLTKNSLDIPATNFVKNTFYRIQVSATANSITLTSEIQFFVRDDIKQKSLEEIITPNMISVSPQQGLSGQQTFTAQYTLDNGNENLQFLKDALSDDTQKPWKMTIQVGVNGQVFSSFNLNDILKFTVPASSKANVTIPITFTLQQGEQTFTTVRKILALINAQYDVSKSDLASKITGGSASVSEIATAASFIKAALKDKGGDSCANLETLLANPDGPCTTSEATPCCGHGSCVAGITTKYMCKCTTGFAGLACQVTSNVQTQLSALTKNIVNALSNTPVTAANADSLLNSISDAAKSTPLDADETQNTLKKLKDIAKQVTDPTQLKNVLSTISQTKTSGTSSTSTNTTVAKQSQLSAIDAMKTAVSSFSTTLDPANPEAVIQAPGVAGKSSFIDTTQLKSTDKVSVSVMSIKKTTSARLRDLAASTIIQDKSGVSIVQPAFGKYTKAVVSALAMSKDSLSALTEGKTIVSNNFDIGLIDPSTNTKIPVTQLADKCGVWFTLTATLNSTQDTGASPNIKCKFYNETKAALDDSGCSVKSITALGNYQYQVDCCCNHLTTFMATYEASPTTVNPTFQTIFAHNLGYALLLLAAILTVLLL